MIFSKFLKSNLTMSFLMGGALLYSSAVYGMDGYDEPNRGRHTSSPFFDLGRQACVEETDDYEEATSYFRLAATLGDVRVFEVVEGLARSSPNLHTLFSLGQLYYTGTGGAQQDYAKAYNCLNRANEYIRSELKLHQIPPEREDLQKIKGEVQFLLAEMYQYGDGVELSLLPEMYQYGEGIEESRGKALLHYTLAAHYGSTKAQLRLALMYLYEMDDSPNIRIARRYGEMMYNSAPR